MLSCTSFTKLKVFGALLAFSTLGSGCGGGSSSGGSSSGVAPLKTDFLSPSNNTRLEVTQFDFSWKTVDSASGIAIKSAPIYLVETFNVANCNGSPVASVKRTTPTFTYTDLEAGYTYSIRTTLLSSESTPLVDTATCSPGVLIFTSVPPANPTIVTADIGSGSTVFAGQSLINIDLGNDPKIWKWCVSETQNTQPASGSAICNGGAGNANGWYTVKPTNFSLSNGDGLKTIYAWVANGSDLVSVAAIVSTISLDTTPPVTTYNQNFLTSSNTQTISGTCADATSGVAIGGIKICIKSTGLCNPYPSADYSVSVDCLGGSYTYNAAVTQGSWDVEVVSVDKVGLASPLAGQGGQNFVVDTTSPTLNGFTAPASNMTIGATDYNFAWNAASDTGGSSLATAGTYKVETFANGTCAGAHASQAFQTATNYDFIGLTNGNAYSIRVSALDQAGNTSLAACSGSITVDRAGPNLTYALTPSSPTNSLTQTVSGTCSDSSGIPAGGIKICLKSSGTCNAYPSGDFSISVNCVGGNYTYTASMTQGTWDIEVVAVDTFGNVSSTQGQGAQNYIVDTTIPTLGGFTAPSGNIYSAATSYNFTWNAASDTGGSTLATSNTYKVETFSNGTCSGAPSNTVNQTATSYNFTSLANGSTYSLRLTAFDKAGNASATSCSGSVSVATCPAASTVTCGVEVTNGHGTDCSYTGTAFNAGQCAAASSVACGVTVKDSCANSCGYVGTNSCFSATGGTITTSGSYIIHTFYSSGTFTPTGAHNVEVLVVGGGGGSGIGGGGAGGVVTSNSYAVSGQAYAVTVGAGGNGWNGGTSATSGQNSVFDSMTALGGGSGGDNSALNGSNGGSGGGSAGWTGYSSSGTAGQGNGGGYGDGTCAGAGYSGGAGGGAGAAGGGAVGECNGGWGGIGIASSISGTSTYYAGGGGGGGSNPNGGNGQPGAGGGGAGNGATGNAGAANTGGGAGGGKTGGNNGGSGIVIIRYIP